MIDILAKHFNLIDPRTSDIPASLNLATNIDARLLVGFSTSRDTFDILPLISAWDLLKNWQPVEELERSSMKSKSRHCQKSFYWKPSLTLT